MEAVKGYFHFFRWVFLIIIILGIALTASGTIRSLQNGDGERSNLLAPEQRVYDYADVLTDDEEQKLEALIAEKEARARCDIVLVTLNESLKEYARGIEPSVPYDEFVRIYAQRFYEENNFGYDAPNGTGVLLLDNWYREDDGWAYTWLCTTGRARERYGESDVDRVLDHVYEYIDESPYRAYRAYINDVAGDMDESLAAALKTSVWISFPVGIIAAVIFFFVNWKSRGGSRTTTAVTYIKGGRAHFTDKRDVFIRKSIVTHHINTNKGGSGSGGGHGGGGGGSHGGGGHRR